MGGWAGGAGGKANHANSTQGSSPAGTVKYCLAGSEINTIEPPKMTRGKIAAFPLNTLLIY